MINNLNCHLEIYQQLNLLKVGCNCVKFVENQTKVVTIIPASRTKMYIKYMNLNKHSKQVIGVMINAYLMVMNPNFLVGGGGGCRPIVVFPKNVTLCEPCFSLM